MSEKFTVEQLRLERDDAMRAAKTVADERGYKIHPRMQALLAKLSLTTHKGQTEVDSQTALDSV